MRLHWMKVIFASFFIMQASTSLAKNELSGWGKPIDPDSNCQFTLTDEALVIVAPGPTHGFSIEIGRMNAPRVLRKAKGDFVLEVKVKGAFEPGERTVPERTPYNGAGLLVFGDERNYVLLQRAVLTAGGKNSHYANFEVRENGKLLRFGQPQDLPLDPTSATWLRLERRGDQILGSVRQEEGAWVCLPDKTAHLPKKTMVGVVAINASSRQFSPRFSELRLYTAVSK